MPIAILLVINVKFILNVDFYFISSLPKSLAFPNEVIAITFYLNVTRPI